jgi:chromate transporter
MDDTKQERSGLLSKLVALFVATFTVSCTANSGYAIIAVMKDDFVNKRKWLTEEEMADYIAIVQSSPGPMAVTSSTIIGYHVAGMPGTLAAVFGVILPPFLVMVVVTLFYEAIVGNPYVSLFLRGMQMGVVAMLIDVIIGLFCNVTKKGWVYPLVIMALSFVYVRFSGFSIAWLVVACIVAGVAKALLVKRSEERQ